LFFAREMMDVTLDVIGDVTLDLSPSEGVQENNVNDADGNSVYEHIIVML
jgi:hypothetical protein